MWSAFAGMMLLIALSIIGAFLGAEEAKQFFNSMPLVIYWFGLAALLIAGFVAFSRLRGSAALFMIHFGCLLVLAGSMWGSESGHRLGNRLFGTDKIANGYMLISKGAAEQYVTAEDLNQRLGKLPFSIKLKDFRIEYYPAEKQMIHNYCSDVTIVENGKEILNNTIKVNSPLHYGGYQFYQDSCDAQSQRYTILGVTSDNGLYAVYTGYWLLCIGTLWHFWLNKILKQWL